MVAKAPRPAPDYLAADLRFLPLCCHQSNGTRSPRRRRERQHCPTYPPRPRLILTSMYLSSLSHSRLPTRGWSLPSSPLAAPSLTPRVCLSSLRQRQPRATLSWRLRCETRLASSRVVCQAFRLPSPLSRLYPLCFAHPCSMKASALRTLWIPWSMQCH